MSVRNMNLSSTRDDPYSDIAALSVSRKEPEFNALRNQIERCFPEDGDGQQALLTFARGATHFLLVHLAHRLDFDYTIDRLRMAGVQLVEQYDYSGYASPDAPHIDLTEKLRYTRSKDKVSHIYAIDNVEQVYDNASWLSLCSAGQMIVLDRNWVSYEGRSVLSHESIFPVVKEESGLTPSEKIVEEELALKAYKEICAASVIARSLQFCEKNEILQALVVQLVYCAACDTLTLCKKYRTYIHATVDLNALNSLWSSIVVLRSALHISAEQEPIVGTTVSSELRYSQVYQTVMHISTLADDIEILKIPSFPWELESGFPSSAW